MNLTSGYDLSNMPSGGIPSGGIPTGVPSGIPSEIPTTTTTVLSKVTTNVSADASGLNNDSVVGSLSSLQDAIGPQVQDGVMNTTGMTPEQMSRCFTKGVHVIESLSFHEVCVIKALKSLPMVYEKQF